MKHEMPPTLQAPRPEWIRVPKARVKGARCPWTGLSRSTILKLVLPMKCNGYKVAVVSKAVKSHPLNRSGVRLVNLRSLEAHIASQTVGVDVPDAVT